MIPRKDRLDETVMGIKPDFHPFVIPGVWRLLETLLVFLEPGNALTGSLDVVFGPIVREPALFIADSTSALVMPRNVTQPHAVVEFGVDIMGHFMLIEKLYVFLPMPTAFHP